MLFTFRWKNNQLRNQRCQTWVSHLIRLWQKVELLLMELLLHKKDSWLKQMPLMLRPWRRLLLRPLPTRLVFGSQETPFISKLKMMHLKCQTWELHPIKLSKKVERKLKQLLKNKTQSNQPKTVLMLKLCMLPELKLITIMLLFGLQEMLYLHNRNTVDSQTWVTLKESLMIAKLLNPWRLLPTNRNSPLTTLLLTKPLLPLLLIWLQQLCTTCGSQEMQFLLKWNRDQWATSVMLKELLTINKPLKPMKLFLNNKLIWLIGKQCMVNRLPRLLLKLNKPWMMSGMLPTELMEEAILHKRKLTIYQTWEMLKELLEMNTMKMPKPLLKIRKTMLDLLLLDMQQPLLKPLLLPHTLWKLFGMLETELLEEVILPNTESNNVIIIKHENISI